MDRLGALYTKGTTRHARAGNRPPRVAETARRDAEQHRPAEPRRGHVVTHYAPQFAAWRVPVIVNVAGEDADDYVHCAGRLDGAQGVAGIELNISCPNIAHGLDFGRDPSAAARLVAAVRACHAAAPHGQAHPQRGRHRRRRARGAGRRRQLALGGQHVHRDEDPSAQRPPGASGRHRWAQRSCDPPAGARRGGAGQRRRSIPVVGIGGITDAGSALDFLVAGAVAVQVGTATFVNPAAALDVLDGLRSPTGPRSGEYRADPSASRT